MRNLGKGFSFGLRSFHRLAILNRPERQLDVSSEPAGRDQPALIPLLAGFPLTRCGPRFSFPVYAVHSANIDAITLEAALTTLRAAADVEE